MKYGLLVSTLVLAAIMSLSARAATHVDFECSMTCGTLEIRGGSSCSGVQLAGNLSKDSAGQWKGEYTRFIYISPNGYELRSIGVWAHDVKANVSEPNADTVLISFERSRLRIPQCINDGTGETCVSASGSVFETAANAVQLTAVRDSGNVFKAFAQVVPQTSNPKETIPVGCNLKLQ